MLAGAEVAGTAGAEMPAGAEVLEEELPAEASVQTAKETEPTRGGALVLRGAGRFLLPPGFLAFPLEVLGLCFASDRRLPGGSPRGC